MSKLLQGAVAGLVLGIAVAASAGASSLPDPRQEGLGPTERLRALLDRVRIEQRKLETLEASFTQLKESAMLIAPVESTGVFSYQAPDRVRWEYTAPTPISLLIAGDEMTTWYRDLDQAERVQVGRHSARILEYLGAGSSMEKLLQYFTVTLTLPPSLERPYELALEPRFARVAKRLAGMDLWIDPHRFLPVRLRYEEPDGDVTEYRFQDLRVNDEIPEERFELELPRSVEVRRIDLESRTGLR